jgi:Phage capsid family
MIFSSSYKKYNPHKTLKKMALEQVDIDKAVDTITKSVEAKGKEIEKTAKDEIALVAKSIDDKVAKAVADATKEVDDKIKAVSEQADKTELKVKGFKATETAPENITFAKALKDAVKEQAEEIERIAKGGKQTETIVLQVQKAAVDLTTANTIGAGSTQVTITQNTGIVSTIRQRTERYISNVSTGSIATNRALWVEETDQQGTPIFIAEGDTKTQLSVKYVEKTQEVQKVAVYGKVTTEMMSDTPQLIAYIQNNLLKRVAIATENQLLVGDGTGENLKGLKTFATAFSAGSLADAIATANEWDVLEAIALQVELAYGTPTAVFVHPSTISRMKLVKDTTGLPVWKSYADNLGNITYAGMRLIGTTAVTAGEFIGGDTTVANVLFREGLTVQIGLDGSDFINNKKTILVEQRLVQFVSANDTPVLVKGTFVSAKSVLDPAVTNV